MGSARSLLFTWAVGSMRYLLPARASHKDEAEPPQRNPRLLPSRAVRASM